MLTFDVPKNLTSKHWTIQTAMVLLPHRILFHDIVFEAKAENLDLLNLTLIQFVFISMVADWLNLI